MKIHKTKEKIKEVYDDIISKKKKMKKIKAYVSQNQSTFRILNYKLATKISDTYAKAIL